MILCLAFFSFLSAYGARCNCSGDVYGDFCQYTREKLPDKNVSPVETRRFDIETLAALAGLGLSNENTQRANSFAIAMGNGAHFVFCLTNPCENDGSCFVTNTATTKVIFRNEEYRISNLFHREFVFVIMVMLVIIVNIY